MIVSLVMLTLVVYYHISYSCTTRNTSGPLILVLEFRPHLCRLRDLHDTNITLPKSLLMIYYFPLNQLKLRRRLLWIKSRRRSSIQVQGMPPSGRFLATGSQIAGRTDNGLPMFADWRRTEALEESAMGARHVQGNTLTIAWSKSQCLTDWSYWMSALARKVVLLMELGYIFESSPST